jgi:hypothetical protein
MISSLPARVKGWLLEITGQSSKAQLKAMGIAG